jgi:hypothetical protein
VRLKNQTSGKFIGGKRRPDDGSPVAPGFDPIVGQAQGGGARVMDEPAPNYPIGNRRTKLEMPEPFVVLTAAGYFAIPTEAGTISRRRHSCGRTASVSFGRSRR